MTLYTETASLRLIDNATDAEGDQITVRRVGGTIPGAWPVVVSLPVGSARIYQDGTVDYDDGGTVTGHPAEGQTAANGAFTYTLWDGIDESPEYTASLTLNGVRPQFSTVVLDELPGATNTARLTFTLTGAADGSVFARIKSNYAGDGKSVPGGFPIEVPVDPVVGGNDYQVTSASNLTPGTTYTALLYHQSATGVQTPPGNDVIASAAFTLPVVEEPPTAITPGVLTIDEGTPAGTVVGQLSADVVNATFSEGTPDLGLVTVSPAGEVTLAVAADTLGASTLKAVATTGGGTHTEDILINVATATGSDIAPDVTFSTWAAVISQLHTWEGNWTGTTPAGKTNADRRVVGYSGSQATGVALSGLDFSGTAGVVIRGVGAFTESGATCRLGGTMNLSGAKKVCVMLLEVTGGTERINVDNTTDVSVERCWFRREASMNSQVKAGYGAFGMEVNGSVTRLTIKNNVFQYFENGFKLNCSSQDAVIAGNIFDGLAHDSTKISVGPHDDLVFRDNVFCRVHSAPAGTNYHEDMCQVKCTIRDGVFERNIGLQGPWYLQSGGTHQCFYFGGGSSGSRRNRFEQNLLMANSGGTKHKDGGLGDATVVYNTQLAFDGAKPSAMGFDWAGGTVDYNVVAVQGSADPNGAGPNGVPINVGNPADQSIQAAYYEGTPARAAMIEAFRPKAGTLTHWNHATPAGCHQLMKDIFVNGQHLENLAPWPAGVIFRQRLNANDALASSTYTGTFDADGNNA